MASTAGGSALRHPGAVPLPSSEAPCQRLRLPQDPSVSPRRALLNPRRVPSLPLFSSLLRASWCGRASALSAAGRSSRYGLAPRSPHGCDLKSRRAPTCVSSERQEFFENADGDGFENADGDGSVPFQELRRSDIDVLRILKGANSFIPHIVLGSTLLALAYPPSFAWFTTRFLPRVCAAIQPFLPPLSVLVTALCVGSPLAINVEAIVSPFGITILLLILGFHASSFVAGYFLPGLLFHKSPDVKALQRTISFETGMQSSLLALALANRFFQDPLVGVPPAISVVLMSLMGFSLVMLWTKNKNEP